MQNDFLNIGEYELDTPIYRIFSIEHFCDLVLTETNTLVHPSKWDDPFENYLLNHKIETKYGPASNHSRKNIYGQCWTLKEESDAMWRIYSSDKKGIKVKTTIRKLFDSFKQNCANLHNQYCYIGKVKYYKREDFKPIRAEFEDSQKWSPNGSLEAKTLLYKREAFSHEEEIRLISFHWEKNPKSELFKYKCNPFELFTEITLDPRLESEEVSRLYEKFEDLGIDNKIVQQSKIYTLEENEFKTLLQINKT